MRRPDARTDEIEVGHESEARVESGAEVMKEGLFHDRMRRGGDTNEGCDTEVTVTSSERRRFVTLKSSGGCTLNGKKLKARPKGVNLQVR